MMHYEPDHHEPDHHEQGNRNKSPLKQHLYSSTYMIGKIDQGQVNPMADDLHADDHYCHPKPQRPSPPAVRFHLEKTSIFLYEAYEGEGDDDEFSFSYFSSRSEEVSFKTTTDRGIMACRQELVDAGEDIFELSNAIQRRHGRIKGVSDIEHLISSVSIRKNLEQILARKQVIRVVLDEQARQRQCNHFDQDLIAMKSMEYSRISIKRARMIGYNNHETLMPSGNRDREVGFPEEQSYL